MSRSKEKQNDALTAAVSASALRATMAVFPRALQCEAGSWTGRYTTRCVLGVAQLPYNHNRSCSSKVVRVMQLYNTPTTGQRSSFFLFSPVLVRSFFLLSAMGCEDRTAQGPNGGAIGMVDDHTKMTDDFTEFVEKMVGFLSCPQLACFAGCCPL